MLANLRVLEPQLEGALYPGGEVIGPVWINPQDRCDDTRRYLPRIVFGNVGLAVLDEPTDEITAQLLGVLTVLFHCTRGEERQHKPSFRCVIGLIRVDDRPDALAVVVVTLRRWGYRDGER